MKNFILITFTILLAAAPLRAQGVVVSGNTGVDFGFISEGVDVASLNTLAVNPDGSVDKSGLAVGGGSHVIGTGQGSFSVRMADNSAGDIYVEVNTSAFPSNISLINCSTVLGLSSFAASTPAIDSSLKQSPAVFNYGGQFSWTSVLNIVPNCQSQSCFPNAFCIKEGSPITDPATDCHAYADFCYSVNFVGEGIGLRHRAGAALNFGTACPPPSGGATGYIKVAPTGAVTTRGSLSCNPGTGATPDVFDVVGTGNPGLLGLLIPSPQDYRITLPADNTVRLTSGANSLNVNDFASYCEGDDCRVGGLGLLGVVSGIPGTTSFSVGAEVEIPPGTPAGVYTGYYPVTVTYAP